MRPTRTDRSILDQVPHRDRVAIKHLGLYGAKVTIRWTNEGWRYDVRFP